MKRLILTAFALLLAIPVLAQDPAPAADAAEANTRLKDLVMIEGMAPVQLVGYGIVVGLDRTGDRARGTRGAAFTIQSITSMLNHFGVTVDPAQLSSRNAAAVMLTAELDPYSGNGSRLDVTVSSLGDARSLSGGILVQTPLINPMVCSVQAIQQCDVFAMAQGPVSTGAVLAATNGSSVQVNHTNTGRIPNGATVKQGLDLDMGRAETLRILLNDPDFTNAIRIADAINAQYADAAVVDHAGRLSVDVPAATNGAARFMASLEDLRIAVDIPARIVINERTGTIVAGGNVRINEVMITYGSLVISTQNDPVISQPNPLGQGQTTVANVGTANISEEATRSVVLQPNTSVNELAAALNDLGLTSRDVIAIFQNIDRAGALQGELVIL
ncbi:MAG: flagellar basal body P-ring protein FlgI [Rhodothermales bacterium]